MTSKRGSAAAREEFWLEAARLTHRRLAPGAEDETEDGTEPENPGDGEAAPDWRQDISDPATGLSRLLSERRGTCILRPDDPMFLGPERTAAFIRQVLDAGAYVVCHQTLTYGDFPDYGPAIGRGFFDSYRYPSRDLLILQAGRRLTEVPPRLVAKAAELGRDAGKAAAGWAFDGNTPRKSTSGCCAASKRTTPPSSTTRSPRASRTCTSTSSRGPAGMGCAGPPRRSRTPAGTCSGLTPDTLTTLRRPDYAHRLSEVLRGDCPAR